MRFIFSILFLSLILSFSYSQNLLAGASFGPGDSAVSFNETDTNSRELGILTYFFDLRDRETFIQYTYPDTFGSGLSANAHIQIFNVGNLCNENDFFDIYTPTDTHVYNMRDILTNDGNPSGVDLPDDAYGFVIITSISGGGEGIFSTLPIGNFRIVDNNGYEYRTNAQALALLNTEENGFSNEEFYSFNYNMAGGVSLSDVVGITFGVVDADNGIGSEVAAAPVQGVFSPFDIDIYDLNEVPFSCRDIIFSCVDQNNPLLETVLEVAGSANVASFEYGINNAVPHSRGSELLCPGNVNSEGVVLLRPEPYPDTQVFNDLIDSAGGRPFFSGYVGLNNGNGRGSMDSFWLFNNCIDNEFCFQNFG